MTTYSKLLLKNNKVQLRNGKALAKGRGLYTPAEITDMINIDGYIPVASATELDNMRNSVSQTMGAGTEWEGNYTTGTDKKYVQVRDIDMFPVFGETFYQRLPLFSGTYDGNELLIDRWYNNSTLDENSLFSDVHGTIKNINLNGVAGNRFDIENGRGTSLLVNVLEVGGVIENCYVCGLLYTTFLTTLSGSGVCAINNGIILNSHFLGDYHLMNSSPKNGAFCSENNGIIQNCSFQGNVFNITGPIGGLVGENNGSIINSTVRESVIKVTGPRTAATGYSAICAVNQSTGIIQNCKSINTTTIGWRQVGGIVGQNWGLVENCETIGGYYEAKDGNNYPQIAGIAGAHASGTVRDCKSSAEIFYAGTNTTGGHGGCIGSIHGSAIVENCYSTGKVTSPSTQKGGLVGLFLGGTIINSYYDSDTSGQSDTGKGEPRTTLQLQRGTADSFINPDGSVDLTESSANAMFTAWDNTIWKFNPNNKYPRLR